MSTVLLDLEEALSVYKKISQDELLQKKLSLIIDCAITSIKKGGKIIFAGNGGSFADAQHLAAELVSRLQFERVALPSLALGTNSSVMSAIANDYDYSQIFSRELSALGSPDDLFIAISTSGNSKNIIESVNIANTIGIKTFGFTGAKGGNLADLVECIQIPSNRTERVQEGHILVGHIICAQIETRYFQNK